MAGLGKALFTKGKTTVLGNAEDRTVDPARAVVARGIFQPQSFNKGTYGEVGRYYFPDHPQKKFIRGVTAGHAIEGEILRRVARHPSDPFGLKEVGIDNQTFDPDWDDIHDMAYVEWAGGRSVYSEIERAGGLLDQLSLRLEPWNGPDGSGQDDELGRVREELRKASDALALEAAKHEELRKDLSGILRRADVPASGGGKFAKALREVGGRLGEP